MAFVAINNPSGLLHHGGQMAWDAISDTRVAMVTITADNKALIQEINQVDGAPVVGTPSFIAQLTVDTPSYYHFRPKIKSMGNDRVFVMVPAAWVTPAHYDLLWGSAASFSNKPSDVSGSQAQRQAVSMPRMYTGYVMERNSSGQYTVKSSAQIDTLAGALSGATHSCHLALNISSANSSQVQISRSMRAASGIQGVANNLVFAVTTINLADGIIGDVSVGVATQRYIGNFPQQMTAGDIKNIKDLQGKEIEAVAVVGSSLSTLESGTDRYLWTLPVAFTLYSDCYLISGSPLQASIVKGVLAYPTLNGLAMPDADKKSDYYAVGGNTPDTAVSSNKNYLSQAETLYCPLDTAWVHSGGVVCIVGGKAAATSPLVVCDNDLAMHLRQSITFPDFVDSILPLKLSFRQTLGTGHYIGPFDPIKLPYFYRERSNNNKIIHKVDDSHFWLIGCFMENETAASKLGVISVSV